MACQETNKMKATWMQQPSFMRNMLPYVTVNLHHKENPGFCNEVVMQPHAEHQQALWPLCADVWDPINIMNLAIIGAPSSGKP